MFVFKGGGEFIGAGSSRNISDPDQDFEREVSFQIVSASVSDDLEKLSEA